MKLPSLYFLLLISAFLALSPAHSDTGTELGKVLLKSVELEFEPEQVRLLEMDAGSRLRSINKSFRILKGQQNESNKKVIVVTAALISDQTKPVSLLFSSGRFGQEASSVLIEDRDLVNISEVESIRSNILDLRTQYGTLSKSVSKNQKELEVLKTKAAELARISRLVEAQTTVSSLSRKLNGLLSDQANLKHLLETVTQQAPSARLASSEAALSRDLRLLSQEVAGAKREKGLLLSESKRESAKKIIEQARGLNLESLRRQAQAHKGYNYGKNSIEEEQESLAAEYAKMHKQDLESKSQSEHNLQEY